MEPTYRGLGRCSCAFWLAVSFDIFGLLILLIGVFANVFFYDFLIYAGAIVIFLSLIWWVFWYTGNIEVPPEELEDDVGLLKKDKGGITAVVRRFSSRLSSGIRNSLRRNGGTHRGQAGAGAQRTSTGLSAHARDAQQPENPTVSLAMAPYEDVHTVSAAVGSDIPHTATETSPI